MTGPVSPFFKIPLDLPHAGRIAFRITRRIAVDGPDFPPESAALLGAAISLRAGENPHSLQRPVSGASRMHGRVPWTDWK